MTHRDTMLVLFAQWKLGEGAAKVLALRAGTLEPRKGDFPAWVLEEDRRLRQVVRRRWGVAGERVDPRLRSWQVTDGGNH